MLAAEKAHRAHAIVKQVIADLNNGRLAHLPSGHFWANSAWLVCAAIAFNLNPHRRHAGLGHHRHNPRPLITVPGRLPRSARRLTLHLPTGWPWREAWQQLSATANSGFLQLRQVEEDGDKVLLGYAAGATFQTWCHRRVDTSGVRVTAGSHRPPT